MMQMNSLQFKKRVIEFSKSYLYRNFWLFLALLLVSLHQASILTYVDFGLDIILTDEPPNKTFSGRVDFTLLGKVGFSKIAAKLCHYLIVLFFVQSVPTFIYGCFKSLRSRRIAALIVFFLPASSIFLSTFSLESILLTIFLYTFLPVAAVSTPPGFMFFEASGSTEDFSDFGIFQIAVVGWFYVFWLGVLIKVWLFSKLAKSKSRSRKSLGR
jgi:hypothetical protein